MKLAVSLCLICCLALSSVSARDSRKLLQDASTLLTVSSEAQAAAEVQANLTASSPNVTAASSAMAQAAASSTGGYSAALASAFANTLINADGIAGNATAQALSSAFASVSNNSTTTTTIAQSYASALLSFYDTDNVAVSVFNKCRDLHELTESRQCCCCPSWGVLSEVGIAAGGLHSSQRCTRN